MLKNILSGGLLDKIKLNYSLDKITEVRLRLGKNIMLGFGSKYVTTALLCRENEIEHVISKATNYSLYRVNETLKKGYIPYKGGVRIGVCGEVVSDNNEVVTIKNITSLVIRIPHEREDLTKDLVDLFLDNKRKKVLSTLVISPAGGGKTTFLRAFTKAISSTFSMQNILVLDDRGELSSTTNFDTGIRSFNNVDVLYGANKAYSFAMGVQNLRPDTIICDELVTKTDIESVIYASTMGVKVVASIHAESLGDLKLKHLFDDIFSHSVFDRFVVLSSENNVGEIQGIYNSDKELLVSKI